MNKYIANVYAELIRKGKKTIDQIPERLKEEVIAILVLDGFVEE